MSRRLNDDSSIAASIVAGRHDRRRLLRRLAGAGIALGLFERFLPAARAAESAVDVVVVGAGAAGMTAALAAAKRGLAVVVVEKAAKFGGSTARSGGGIWIRGNEVLSAAGVRDDPAQAARYLASVVGDDVPDELQAAFLANGPAMISFIMRSTPLRFRWMEGYAEYYPERSGGMPNGASIEPAQLDAAVLGDELAALNDPYMPMSGVIIYASDYRWLNLVAVSAKGGATALRCAARHARAKLAGRKVLTMGQALAAGLRAGLRSAGVPVWLSSPLLDLLRDDTGRIVGVVVTRGGVPTALTARRGVIIASGGFEHDQAMRAAWQRQPVSTAWSVGAKENTGDGIRAGLRAGAAVRLMDDAWWGPVVPLPGQSYFCLAERSMPGCIMVSGAGTRFVNESAPYPDVVRAMYGAYGDGQSQAVWLIFDQTYRNRYLFRDIPPALALPAAWYEAGVVHRNRTVVGLALAIGVPPDALYMTIERFNGLAARGRDDDFARGDSAYDRYYSDPSVTPNPCLGPLTQAPYYAVKIVPGDLGTKGGLRTDARARVLRADGSVIAGLYAAGNASASVMGRGYAAAGATLGPAMTFGFIAGNAI